MSEEYEAEQQAYPEPRSVEEIMEEMDAESKAKWDARFRTAKGMVKQAAGQFADTAKAFGKAAGLKGAGLDAFMGGSLDGMGRMAVVAGVGRYIGSLAEREDLQAEEDKSAMYVPDDAVLADMRAKENELRMQGVKPKRLLYTDAQARRMGNGDISRAIGQGLLKDPDGRAVMEHMADVNGGASSGYARGGVRVVDKIKKLPDYSAATAALFNVDEIGLVEAPKDLSQVYANAIDDMSRITERDRAERAAKDVRTADVEPERAEHPGAAGRDRTAERVADAESAFGRKALGEDIEGPGWGDYGA